MNQNFLKQFVARPHLSLVQWLYSSKGATTEPMQHAFKVLLYGLASGIVGDRLSFVRSEQPASQARLEILLSTPDEDVPEWIRCEWDNIVSIHDRFAFANRSMLASPKEVPALEKRLQRFQSLALDEIDEARDIRERLDFTRNHGEMRLLHVMGGGRPQPRHRRNGRDCMLAVSDVRHLKRVMWRNELRPCEHPPTRMTGWISFPELRKLARSTPVETLAKLAWIVRAPDMRWPQDEIPEGTMPQTACSRAVVAKLLKQPVRYQPRGRSLALLNACGSVIDRMVAEVPDCIRDDILPDRDVHWHLAAAASVLHFSAEESADPNGFDDGWTSGACSDACRLVAAHIHNLRILYPCDGKGWFAGNDLKLFRVLSTAPDTIRALQRSTRGVTKSDVLSMLGRAMAAGLAVEASPGRFAIAPQMELKASEIGAEIAEWLMKIYNGPFFHTDITDKPRRQG